MELIDSVRRQMSASATAAVSAANSVAASGVTAGPDGLPSPSSTYPVESGDKIEIISPLGQGSVGGQFRSLSRVHDPYGPHKGRVGECAPHSFFLVSQFGQVYKGRWRNMDVAVKVGFSMVPMKWF